MLTSGKLKLSCSGGNRSRLDTIVYTCPVNITAVRLFVNFFVYIFSGCRDSAPLGMQNGLIHDAQITGSSYRYHTTSPQLGRLHGPDGWLSAVSDSDLWFQVDFIAKVFVYKVQTQGFGNGNFFVQTYKLLYGDNGYIFTEYSEDGGSKVCAITVHCVFVRIVSSIE